jgi:hypothetical protein
LGLSQAIFGKKNVFFFALNYFNKHIFCSNVPKKPEKARKIKMPDNFQKRPIPPSLA